MTQLYMTSEETVCLRHILSEYLRRLESEIGRTDSPELREELERTESALMAIVGELRGDAA